MIPAERFLADVRSFRGHGSTTALTRNAGIPYYINEYWTAKQRQAHSIHEISYRACFKAQLPEFFIERLTRPGDVVLDPFMGRGTTLVQAALMDRRAIGNDINPLSILLARPRLAPMRIDRVREALQTIDWTAPCEEPRGDLLAFYHVRTLEQIQALRAWLNNNSHKDQGGQVNAVKDWIRMVAISRLSGHSPGFFSVRSLPPNQAVSARSQARINHKLGQTPPLRDVQELIIRKTRSLLRDGAVSAAGQARLYARKAWDMPQVPAGSVDLVVTSPPFLDVVHYAADNWLRCWFAGIDPEKIEISSHSRQCEWTRMVRWSLEEMARVVRPKGYVAFEVGEVSGGRVLLERLVWQACAGLPFSRIGVLVNRQQFTKTANCWGITNASKGTNTNRIVLLQRT